MIWWPMWVFAVAVFFVAGFQCGIEYANRN